MKIALDATYSLGEEISGIGVYSRELMAGVARAHQDVSFEYCYRPHRFLRSFSLSLPPNSVRRLLCDPLWLPSPDLFHGLNQRLPRKRFRRAVSTFHDLFVLTDQYSTAEFRHRFARQARHAAALSDRIIAVSEFTAGQIERLLGVDRRRLRVIHHGIRPLPPSSIPRERVILSVGALQRRKNTARLVEAFGVMDSSWRLALVGGAGYGGEEILAQIGKSRCRNRILTLGYLSDDELAKWYSRAMIFAFPSLDEGFGMPILEAMAAGLPVLTSDRSALPEVAGGAALLINPEIAEQLADGLKMLGSDEDLRARLIDRGKHRAAEFTWEKAAAKTWAVYQELL